MSTGDGRKVTHNEIDQVKGLIETCILNYMKKKDVIGVLYQKHNIEPCFTRMVWRRLEEQNMKFFRNYYLRLALKDQITRFNEALEMQADMVKRLNARNEVEALPPSGLNNCATLGLQHASGYPCNTFSAQNPNAEMIEQVINIGMIRKNNEYGDFGNISAYVSSSNSMGSNSHQLQHASCYPSNTFLAQNPNAEMIEQGMNIGMIRKNNEYGDFGNISAYVSSLNSMGSNSHQLQHASCYSSNTFLAQNPNAEMIEQGTNSGMIGINNECGDFGSISASVSSTMDSNSHQLQRTFTDDLLEYIASQPEGLFDSYGVTEENQGGNISSSFDFENYNNFS